MERCMALACQLSDDIGMTFGLSKCAVLSVCKGEVIPSEILPGIPNLMEKKGISILESWKAQTS
eukprot:15347932-Ditylum_brightwellii.AAC.1